MKKLNTVPTIIQLLKFNDVAGGILAVAARSTGTLINLIQLWLGNDLYSNHTKNGATRPPRKHQLRALYSPRPRNILRGPTNPQITDASKKTLITLTGPWTVGRKQARLAYVFNAIK